MFLRQKNDAALKLFAILIVYHNMNGIGLSLSLSFLGDVPICQYGSFDMTAGRCACFSCVYGEKCDILGNSKTCELDVSIGNPTMFESYWEKHREVSHTVYPAHHLDYGLHTSSLLENLIRELHRVVGNADTKNKYVVIGAGSTALIPAAIYGLLQAQGTSAVAMHAHAPYYAGYRYIAELFPGWSWLGGSRAEQKCTTNKSVPVVELITTPNNPDGQVRYTSDSVSMQIVDHAYYWPTFTGIDHATSYSNTTVSLFTLSKLTGHASTRIGWALTSSEEVAKAMEKWTFYTQIALSTDAQLKAITIMAHLVKNHKAFFSSSRARMQERWKRLRTMFNNISKWQLDKTAFDATTNDLYASMPNLHPSPAYAWLRHRDKGTACAILGEANIRSACGSNYGSADSYARLSLLMRDHEFELLLEKLSHLQ